MKGLKKAGAIFDSIIRGLWFVAGVLLLLITALVIVDVSVRSISPLALAWIDEIGEYMLFTITFFGATWCLKIGEHVRVDFIFSMLKERVQLLVSMITSTLGTIMCLAYAYYAGQATWLSIERGTHLVKMLKVPKYTFTSIMCICALLLTIEFLRQTYKYLRMWGARRNNVETREVR